MASTSSVGSSQAQQLIEERRRLFQPYSSRCEKGSGTPKSAKREKSIPTHIDRSICVFSRSTSMQSAAFLGKTDLAAGWPWPKKDQIFC